MMAFISNGKTTCFGL